MGIGYSCHIVPEVVCVTNHERFGCVALHGWTPGRANECWTLELRTQHLADIKRAVRFLEEQETRELAAAKEQPLEPQPIQSAREGGF